MAGQAVSSFTGSIPDHYERGLGPVIFADFAADMARRVAATGARRVLEIAAGTQEIRQTIIAKELLGRPD